MAARTLVSAWHLSCVRPPPRTPRTAMRSPLNHILVPLPWTTLMVGIAFDVLVGGGAPEQLSIAAFWSTAIGVTVGFFALLVSVFDWPSRQAPSSARRIGWLHAGLTFAALCLFATAVALRSEGVPYTGTPAVLGLELTAFAIAGLGGYWGGELKHRYGIPHAAHATMTSIQHG